MGSSTRTRLDWAMFGMLGFVWGSSYLFIKIGIESFPPFTLVAGRLSIGVVLLAVAMVASGRRLPRERNVYGHLLVMAILNIVLPFWLTTWGEGSIDSALAAILNATIPLFTIAFAAAALSDEPISIGRLGGLAIGFAGVFLVVSPSAGAGLTGSMAGQLALLVSSVSYALGNVYARRAVRNLDPLVTAFLQVGFAALISAGLSIVVERPFGLRLRVDAVFAVVWLGLSASGLAYLLWYRLLGDWGSTRASLVAYSLPVVGIVLGVLAGGESITFAAIVGTILIVLGAALVSFRASTPSEHAARPPVRVAPRLRIERDAPAD